MDQCLDPYEEQLFEVFASHDSDHDGALDRSGLVRLCETLQLQDKSDDLIAALLRNRCHLTVTFAQFRDALLQLLGGMQTGPADGSRHQQQQQQQQQQQHEHEHCEAVSSQSTFMLNSESVKLGPDGSGHVSSEVVSELWELAGIASPKMLLKDLGFNSNTSVDVSKLAAILEKEIKSLLELRIDHTSHPLIALLQAFITIYQAEIKCLKSLFQQVCDEKEKLKMDIAEAHNRSALLAQEVDDNVAKMEQKMLQRVRSLEARHSDALRELAEQVSSEKEQMLLGSQTLEAKIRVMESDELALRESLQSVRNYVGVVEAENKKLTGTVFELEEAKIHLEQRIDDLELEKLKVLEAEAVKSNELMDEIGMLKRENGMLKDKNDEMECQIETLSKELTIGRKWKSCEEAAYLDGIVPGSKRRNGEAENGKFDFECAITGSPRLGKMRKFQEAKEAVALDALFTASPNGDNDYADGGRLSPVHRKVELVDCLLRKYAIKLDCNENCEETYTKMLEQLLDYLLRSRALHDDIDVEGADLRTALMASGQSATDDDVEHSERERNEEDDDANRGESGIALRALRAENAALAEKCANLQQGLGLLRDEYELCEDYWQKKLEDERAFYELEQAQSGARLGDVLARLAEYEAQLHRPSDDADGAARLPTIDESHVEAQYADLEAAFEAQAARVLALQLELAELQHCAPTPAADVGVQVDDDLKYLNLGVAAVAHFEFVPSPPAATMPLKTRRHRRHRESACDRKRYAESSSSSSGSEGGEQLHAELKYFRRLYDHLCKSHAELYASSRSELQHAYAKLDQQVRVGAQLHEKLAGSDVLVGNLYIENAYLIKNNQRLEQQLQMFAKHADVSVASF